MDLPNKSDQQPEQKKQKLAPVVPQGAVRVPRPATRRFLDFMFAESPKSLGAKIGRDVIVPRLKAGFEEAANSFLAGMLWGNGGQRPMSNIVQGTVLRAGGINYNQLTHSPSPASQAMMANQARSAGGYQDLVVPTQQHAEIILANMYDTFNRYRVVTVADLYELANITPAPSDNSYGWLSLDGAKITKDRDGYRLEFPKPSLI